MQIRENIEQEFSPEFVKNPFEKFLPKQKEKSNEKINSGAQLVKIINKEIKNN